MILCEKKLAVGRIHSLESFATHDGPGIRFLVFLQGCAARCQYCQNPDTWDLKAGFAMSAEEILAKVKRCMPYITASHGGVTVSGGEPLLQIEFLIELFRLCKREAIHTAVDTSAFCDTQQRKRLRRLSALTDLFIVDIKATDAASHKKITARELSEVLEFLDILESARAPFWLRYVLVPGLNDSKNDMRALRRILDGLTCCEKFEFLPYHTLGKHKWEYMGLRYPLGKQPAAGPRHIKKARLIIESAVAPPTGQAV